jgi:hypothetical protein
MLPTDPSERAFMAASVINGGLGAAVGGLAAGIPGLQAGLIVGLMLAILPLAAQAISHRLARPRGLARFLCAEIAGTAVRAAAVMVDSIGQSLKPAVDRAKVPVFFVRFSVQVFRTAAGSALTGLWRIAATPLGMANIAALVIVSVNLAGLQLAGPVVFLGLAILVLILLVSENEARDEAKAGNAK